MSTVIPRLRRIATRTVRNPRLALTEARLRLFTFLILARDPEAYQFVSSWAYGDAPRVPIRELFPTIETEEVRIERVFDRDIVTSLTAKELLVLCSVVRHVRPQRILEIGTFDGNTTRNIAANAPDNARVTTIDLPPDWDGQLGIPVSPDRINVTPRETVGRQFRGSECEHKIRQVFGDSACLRWDQLGGPFDLIFIDGCHEYEYVRSDTQGAMRHISPRGLILWHDYGNFEGVSRAVDEVGTEMNVRAIQGTRLATGTASCSPLSG